MPIPQSPESEPGIISPLTIAKISNGTNLTEENESRFNSLSKLMDRIYSNDKNMKL